MFMKISLKQKVPRSNEISRARGVRAGEPEPRAEKVQLLEELSVTSFGECGAREGGYPEHTTPKQCECWRRSAVCSICSKISIHNYLCVIYHIIHI
jgi:hypothetical protein